MKHLGIDLSFVQPPLPTGKEEEIAGTEEWCHVLITESSKRTSLGWWDLRQVKEVGEETALLGSNEGGGKAGEVEGYENWWPGVGRWRLGMLMEESDVDCPAGTHWKVGTD